MTRLTRKGLKKFVDSAKELLAHARRLEEDASPTSSGMAHSILWAHLTSRHAVIIGPDLTYADMLDMHAHEHNGPGGIRDHDEASRVYNIVRMGEILMEAKSLGRVDDIEGAGAAVPPKC